MSLIQAFLNHRAIVEPFMRDAGAKPVYGIEEERACRIEEGSHMQAVYKNLDGTADQIVAKAKMFCVGDPIPERSRVRFGSRSFVVVSCETKRGFGFSHLEVLLM